MNGKRGLVSRSCFYCYILDVEKRIKPLTSVEIIILHNNHHPTPGNLVLFNPDVREEYFHLFFVTFKCQIEFLTAKYVSAALPAFPEYSEKKCVIIGHLKVAGQ